MKNSEFSEFVDYLDHCSEPAKKLRDFIRYIPGRIFFCIYQEHLGCTKYNDELNYWVNLQKFIDGWLKEYNYLFDYLESKDFWKYSTKFEEYHINHALYLSRLNHQAKQLCLKIFHYECLNFDVKWREQEKA